jgi:hypothetical protein
MPRVRKADAGGKDRGVQLEMPGGAEPAPPGGGGPRGPADPPGAARGSARPGGSLAPAAAPSERPPVILQLGPRDYSRLVYDHGEDGEPVYRVLKEKIKAASTAAVLARKLFAKAP